MSHILICLWIKLSVWGSRVLGNLFLSDREMCWLSKTSWTPEVVLWSSFLLFCLFSGTHCTLYLKGYRKLESLSLKLFFFRVLQLNLCVHMYLTPVLKLIPNLSDIVASAASTEITLWCLLLSPRAWGTSSDWCLRNECIIIAFSMLRSLCSHCPSQIPSWRLRSASLLMRWAAILLLQKWILVEMPWEIWEQRCWQKPCR